MVNLIVDQIVTGLKLDLSFVDKITGIVKPAKVDIDGKGTIKTFPVAYNTDPTTCNDSELLDFVPDSSKISIIYFEDRGTTLNRMENQSLYFTSNFTLVCWFNYKRLVGNMTNPSLIVGNVIKYLPVVMGNISPLIGVVLSVTGQQDNTGGVFSKYTYIEEQSQFITYPYGYFALDMQAEYSVRKECFTDVEIQELSC
jgi:hypothetical protein